MSADPKPMQTTPELNQSFIFSFLIETPTVAINFDFGLGFRIAFTNLDPPIVIPGNIFL